MYFPSKFLAKLKIDINEIHEKDIDNDDHEPVPEYDTAIEHEESNNGREVTEVQLKEDIIEKLSNDEVELNTLDEKARNDRGFRMVLSKKISGSKRNR